MPDPKLYLQNTYRALKDNLDGFNTSEQDYYSKMQSDTSYRQKVYHALSDNLDGFNKSYDDFSGNLGFDSKEVQQQYNQPQAPAPNPDLDNQVRNIRQSLQVAAQPVSNEIQITDPLSHSAPADNQSEAIDRKNVSQSYADNGIQMLSDAWQQPKENVADVISKFPNVNDSHVLQQYAQLKNDNPVLYNRTAATNTWQSNLLGSIRENAPEKYNDVALQIQQMQQGGAGTSFKDAQQNLKYTAQLINENISDPAKREAALNALKEDSAINYSGAIPGTDEVVNSDKDMSFLNKQEKMGLQFLTDINDPTAQGFRNNIGVNPASIQQRTATGKPDLAAIGYSEQKAKLAAVGADLQLRAASQHIASYDTILKNGGQLTPEQQQEYQYWSKQQSDAEELQDRIHNPNDKDYGYAAQFELNNVAQELVGQKTGFFTIQRHEFQNSVNAPILSAIEMGSQAFGSDENNKRLQLAIIGANAKSETANYVTQANQPMQQFSLKLPDDLQDKVTNINNDKNLTDDQKREQVAGLLAINHNWYKQPTDTKFNLTANGLLYGVGDAMNAIGSFLVNEAAMGGAGNISKARKALATFSNVLFTDYAKNYVDDLKSNKPNPALSSGKKAFVSAFVFAGGNATGAIDRIFGNTAAASVLKNIPEEELVRMAEKAPAFYRNLGKSFLESQKGNLHMTALGTTAQVANDVLSGDTKDVGDYAKQGLLQYVTTLPLSLLGMGSKMSQLNDIQKHGWYDIASKPEQFSQAADEMVSRGTLSPDAANTIKQNIAKAGEIYSSTNFKDDKGKPLSDAKKSELLLTRIKQSNLEEAGKQNNSDKTQAKIEHETAVTNEYANLIHEGADNDKLEKRKESLQKKLDATEDTVSGKSPVLNDKERATAKAQIDAIEQYVKDNPNEAKQADNKSDEPIPAEEAQPATTGFNQESKGAEKTVGELIGKPILYDGKEATLYQDGQTLIAAIDGTNREYEIGNVDKVSNEPLSNHKLSEIAEPESTQDNTSQKQSVVSVADNGNFLIRGKEYINPFETRQNQSPLEAVTYNDSGDVVNVRMKTPDGKRVTIRGEAAEDLAYQIHLKEINKNNAAREEFEQFINADESVAAEINDAGLPKATEEKPVENNAEVPATAQPASEPQPEAQQPAQTQEQSTDQATGAGDGATTSVKNAVTLSERQQKGMDEVEVLARRNFGDVFDKGKELVDSGKIDPRALAKSLSAKPRPLKPEETVAILYDRMRLQNEHAQVNNLLQDAFKNDDKAAQVENTARLAQLEDAINYNDEASRRTGYEQGLGLAIRKLMIKQDYSLANQLQQFKNANGGEDIPADVREKVESLTNKLKEASDKLDEYEKRISDLEAQKHINSQKPKSKTNKSDEEFKNEREQIFANIKDKWNKVGNEDKGQLNAAIPLAPQAITKSKQLVAIAPDVLRLVKSYAEQGVIKLGDIVDDLHANISKSIPDITKKDVTDILAGEYTEKKAAPTMTPEKMKLQANIEKIKDQIENEKLKIKQANRTGFQKGLDWFAKFRRAVILSSVQTLGKLTTAASYRQLTNTIEEVIGSGLNKIPGLSAIAKGAPREGGDINMKAEAKSIAQWWAKDTYKDVAQIIKTGKGELDYLYGKKRDMPQSALEFIGHVHGALKAPAKRAEFQRAFEKRALNAERNGEDISSPEVQARIAAESYVDANRAIFMQDNILTNAYQDFVRKLDKSESNKGKVAATALRVLIPIVKIPSNYVAEATSYAAGGLKVLPTIFKAISKGLDSLSADEKDYVMRNLKKQSLGAAIFAMGYLNPQAVGGYYTGKRKGADIDAGYLSMFGVKMPHWMLHAPILEVLQMGSTFRRVQDEYSEKGKGGGDIAALGETAKGLVEEVPFMSQMTGVSKATEDEKGFNAYTGNLAASILVPPDVQKIARAKDIDSKGNPIKRSPQSVGEYIKSGIPGLREEVGKNAIHTIPKSEHDKKAWKFLTDKGVELPSQNKNTVTIKTKEGNRKMTDDEYDKYFKARTTFIENFFNKAIDKNGKYSGTTEDGKEFKSVHIKDMNAEQLKSLRKKIEAEATRVTKKKMFNQ